MLGGRCGELIVYSCELRSCVEEMSSAPSYSGRATSLGVAGESRHGLRNRRGEVSTSGVLADPGKGTGKGTGTGKGKSGGGESEGAGGIVVDPRTALSASALEFLVLLGLVYYLLRARMEYEEMSGGGGDSVYSVSLYPTPDLISPWTMVPAMAMAIFVVTLMADLLGLFSSNPLKRELFAIVSLINLVALVTYAFSLAKAVDPVRFGVPALFAMGREVDIMRYVEWCVSTPLMVYLMWHLSLKGREAGGAGWRPAYPAGTESRSFFLTAAADVAMVITGCLSDLFFGVNPALSNAFLLVSCGLFYVTMRGMYAFIQRAKANMFIEQDIDRLNYMRNLTFLTWTLFPVVTILARVHVISFETQNLLYTITDTVAKVVYSGSLLNGNFYTMGVIEAVKELRKEVFLTDALETSRRLGVAKSALEMANQESGATAGLQRVFLANISHELRTPLNSVIGFNTVLLEDTNLKKEQREYVSSSISSAESLLGVINQILEYSKLQTEDVDLPACPEPFALDDFADQLTTTLTIRAETCGVDFLVNVQPGLETLVLFGEAFRFRQALVNLCDNAIRFSSSAAGHQGGGSVEVRVRKCTQMEEDQWRLAEAESGNHYFNVVREEILHDAALGGHILPHDVLFLAVEVVDNGLGMSVQEQERLFLPFSQGDGSSTRKHGGTGLGLITSKLILSRLGGHVWARSSGLGKGSTFTVLVAFVPDPSARPTRSGTLAGAAVDLRVKGNELLQNVLTQHLADWGANLCTGGAKADCVSVVNVSEAKRSWKTLRASSAIVVGIGSSEFASTSFAKQDASKGHMNCISMGRLHEWIREQRAMAPSSLPAPETSDSDDVSLPHALSAGVPPAQTAGVSDANDRTPADSLACADVSVLIVEDNPVNQRVCKALLDRLGCSVAIADNGMAALELIEARAKAGGTKFDIIFMDIQMPVMDGIQATIALRKLEAAGDLAPLGRHKVVALTANWAAEDRDVCLYHGMDGYIPKPVYKSTLMDAIRLHVISRRT